MNKFLPFLLTSLFIISCSNKNEYSLKTPAEKVKEHYIMNLRKLDSALGELGIVVKEDRDEKTIHDQFFKSRLLFKKIEYLAEFYNPVTAKNMNGAAIPKVEEDDPNQVTIEPTGFQVLEEMIFPELLKENSDGAIMQISGLRSDTRRLQKVIAEQIITDEHIFSALKSEIVRVIALGISGFDSPVAFHSIPEAKSAIETIDEVLNFYNDGNSFKNDFTTFKSNHSATLKYLEKNQDFNSFDRITFISEFANPLSSQITKIQSLLKITPSTSLKPIAAHAETIFSADAFKSEYFAPTYARDISQEKIELGKILFFDPVLSGNGLRTCASCHKPELAFTDGRAKSMAFGFKNDVARNAPTLLNAGLQRATFYDMRTTFLEDQATAVLNNVDEMHSSLDEAAGELRNSAEYSELFKKAFGGNSVNEQNIRIALAAYVRSLVSLNSRFDKFMRGEKTALTASEKNGFNVFMGKAKCGTCHFMPLFNGTVPPDFTETEFEIIGVPAHDLTFKKNSLDADLGRFNVHKMNLHKNAFKTPTVRNIALTAPYMHNGVFKTLEEVLEFYDLGGGVGIGLDVANQTLPSDKLNLSDQEETDVISFLKALTDTADISSTPKKLPVLKSTKFLKRKLGGEY
ncbi:MAG: cytochrome c peroxidase [Bacteroidota bacterium]